MAKIEDTPTRKQLTTLAWIGLLLWSFFAGGCAWGYYYYSVPGHGGFDTFTLLAAIFFFPYLIVISVYLGSFMAKFAKGRWKYPWLWGIGSVILTILFILGSQALFSSVFPDQSLALFAVPFVAPVLSTLLSMLLISIRRKAAL